jgi:hypothetical protein
VLVAAACGLRFVLAAQAPFDFAVMRQHHSALIARSLYLESRADAAAPARASATGYLSQATRVEPLVIERLSAWGYALAGREDLRIPRMLSASFWIAGGLFLYVAARRLSGQTGAVFALAAFLFLPYTWRSSVSIQPDPFAVMWLCGGLFGLARLYDEWTTPRVVAAALLAIPAIFVRPMTACFLYSVFALLLWDRPRNAISAMRSASVYVLISAAPAAVFIARGLVGDDAFVTRAGASFVPGLLVDMDFWRGWARNAWLAFGPLVFGGALLAAAFVAAGRLRIVLAGLWIGYGLYGLIFNLHVSTHPYYQTLAVPGVALSLASFGPAAGRWLQKRPIGLIYGAAALVLALMSVAAFGSRGPADARIEDYRAIGDAVGHSQRVVFLSPDWGTPLRYYGEIGGRYWPSRFEVGMYRPLGARGIADSAAEQRLAALSEQIGGADFFVVTDLEEFVRQEDLRSLLENRHRVHVRTDRYVIYELSR